MGYTEHRVNINTVESGKKYAQCDCAWGSPIVPLETVQGLVLGHYREVGLIIQDS